MLVASESTCMSPKIEATRSLELFDFGGILKLVDATDYMRFSELDLILSTFCVTVFI